jgi:phage tail sheath protein FI
LVGCLGSKPRLAQSQTEGVRLFFRRLGEAAALGGGEYGPCPDLASYTLAYALQLRKITENFRLGSRTGLG